MHFCVKRGLSFEKANSGNQEIAPVYFDMDTLEDGDIKRSLARAAEKKRRKEAMKKASR